MTAPGVIEQLPPVAPASQIVRAGVVDVLDDGPPARRRVLAHGHQLNFGVLALSPVLTRAYSATLTPCAGTQATSGECGQKGETLPQPYDNPCGQRFRG